MATAFNSPAKNIIRTYWGKPLLAFLNEHLGKKLFYLRLPSPEAQDIHAWLEHIDRVYAFQCRQYPLPSDDTQSREAIEQLEQKLLALERERRIETFEVFDGYIEEVLLKGRDNSPNTKTYSQSEVVTVYNMDFCNNVTEPQKIIDNETGVEIQAYKMEAIERLLHFQNEVATSCSKFILFLTIKAGYHGETLNDYISSPPTASLESYFYQIKSLGDSEKKIRILKAFVFDSINQYADQQNFIVEFLPTILYTGNGSAKLLHFTAIGSRTPKKKVGRGPTYQHVDKFMAQKFLTISEEKIKNHSIEIEEKDNSTDPTRLFKQASIYKNLWN